MSVRGSLACAVATAAAAFIPAAAAAAPLVGFEGGTAGTATVCGVARQVRSVAAREPLVLVVAPARQRQTRLARKGSKLVVDDCRNGTWRPKQTFPLGARRKALRVPLSTREGAAADLRVRTKTRAGKFGRAAYVRIGVGEIVDVPVTFHVVNQNRTSIACLPGPDGRTYPVHGSLVAPRSVLDASAPAATLYLHGFGYAGFFFRFQDVPGYDYGRQQATVGHASFFVDRLGNPAHDDLPDGNLSCLPAQADMADQIIKAIRAGNYDTTGRAVAFKRVLLAGHSAGGFITELTQYSFSSADAVAIIGYTDFPSPLTFSTFFAAGQDCLTAPQHAHGTSGAPNYAYFGRTDTDFAAGHFYNIDPAVAAAALARHNRDPCGDFTNALQALLGNHLMTSTIAVPVLVIGGLNDALFSPPTGQLQAQTAFPSSPEVSLVELPDTGHAVTLGRTHEAFRLAMDKWLVAHGA
jgi:pimeloyl-ACP methyl ester carboxylesterase